MERALRLGVQMVSTTAVATPDVRPAQAPSADWRREQPVLNGARLTLRGLRLSDAPALLSMLSTAEVARFISEPPSSVEGFERFVEWAERERIHGRYLCFAIVPHGVTSPIGLFQLKQLESGFTTAEWGFAIGSAFWGSGFFLDGARMLVDFAMQTLGVRRLEARAAAINGRGNGALRKVGAVQEGVLRRAFHKDGRQMDQTLWSILADEWLQTKTACSGKHVH